MANSRPKFAYGTNPTPSEETKDRETLHISTKLGYGAGHVFNDMLQVYNLGFILTFLQVVVGLTAFNSGLVFLFGQISDGLATVLIGLVIDGDKKFRIYNYYGKRKTWYLIGTICVLTSFPFFLFTSNRFRNEQLCLSINRRQRFTVPRREKAQS